MIAENSRLRKEPGQTQNGSTPETELTLKQVLPWPRPGVKTRGDSAGVAWRVQPVPHGRDRPDRHTVPHSVPHTMRIEITIEPSQARLLVELLGDILARPPEPTEPACAGPNGLRSATRAFDLTPREGEILEEMIEGRSNRQIALELEIATATVKCHVSNILSKMGAESRTEAVAMALQQQLRDGRS